MCGVFRQGVSQFGRRAKRRTQEEICFGGQAGRIRGGARATSGYATFPTGGRISRQGVAQMQRAALLSDPDHCGWQRRRADSNRRIEVLQTSALPLGYGAGVAEATGLQDDTQRWPAPPARLGSASSRVPAPLPPQPPSCPPTHASRPLPTAPAIGVAPTPTQAWPARGHDDQPVSARRAAVADPRPGSFGSSALIRVAPVCGSTWCCRSREYQPGSPE